MIELLLCRALVGMLLQLPCLPQLAVAVYAVSMNMLPFGWFLDWLRVPTLMNFEAVLGLLQQTFFHVLQSLPMPIT